jgi:hypothetical protein
VRIRKGRRDRDKVGPRWWRGETGDEREFKKIEIKKGEVYISPKYGVC